MGKTCWAAVLALVIAGEAVAAPAPFPRSKAAPRPDPLAQVPPALRRELEALGFRLERVERRQDQGGRWAVELRGAGVKSGTLLVPSGQ